MTNETAKLAKKIGPFQLHEVVGQAGMGVVWRGIHEEQQVPIAVKFLTEEGARDPLYLGCLKNEVRKVARLEHPAIIHVHDHGEVPKDLGIETLAPGSPYLVMEFAEGGTLSRHCGNLDWEQIWRVLMRLLDGLAHAHARGVVHRDIKPGNVLLRRTSGGVVLTDFGLARAGDTENGAVLNAGTPSYMAPEQILQKAHDIGPWTDMYGLGCLAWSLACGNPPFQADTIDGVLNAHIHEPIPQMEPKTDVPSGFEAWVRQLLRKAPQHRFVRAADAAHALSKIARPEKDETLYIEPVFHADASGEFEVIELSQRTAAELTTAGYDDTQVMMPRENTDSQPKPAPLPKVGKSLLWAQRDELPPFPEDWRSKHPPRQLRHLLGTGLALYGLRNFPVVGRVDEQTKLWDILGRTREESRSRCVIIEGADGMGKTHLAEWLAFRAYEVGAATVLRAGFDDEDDGEPLIGLIRSLLSTDGMDRDAAEAQVRTALELLGQVDDTEVEALLMVLGPFTGEQFSSEVMEERQDVRFTVIRRLLHRFSVLRPIIVVLEDAHRDEESLAFARTMLSERSIQHPVLVVVTTNPAHMSDTFCSALKSFARKKRVSTLKLAPLVPEYRSILIRKLLGLAPTLAALVERRSGGNPQFAVQLVGDWIQKEHLVQTEGGFSLKDGIQPEFPADLEAIWERRLTAALPPYCDTRSLQLAAELGMDVDPDEWTEACAHAGIEIDPSLIETLAKAHVIQPHGRGKGWSFAHTLVREALKRRAEFEGMRTEHHVAVAAMLSTRQGVESRRGRHLFHAGDLEEAVDALLRAAKAARNEGRASMLVDLLTLREEALNRLGVPKVDVRWSEGWMVWERYHMRRGDFSKAQLVLEQILESTRESEENWKILTEAWNLLGGLYRLKGDPKTARLYMNKALESARDDKELIASVLNKMATLELAYGNLTLAEELFERALKHANDTDNIKLQIDVIAQKAAVHRRMGNLHVAREYLSTALKYYRKAGSKRQQSRCLNDLAELDRFAGKYADAEAGYIKALHLKSALGDQRFFVASLNLGIVYSETDRPVEARGELERALRAVKVEGPPALKGAISLILSHVYVQLGDEQEWERTFQQGTDIIKETGYLDVDVARTTELAGRALLERGWNGAARKSLKFARDHWKALERDDKATAVIELLSGIG